MESDLGEDTGLTRLTPALLDGLPAVLDELEKMLLEIAPNYADFIRERREQVLPAAQGVAVLLVMLASRIRSRTEPVPDWPVELDRSQFEEIGRLQWREGTPVSTLLTAYQIGARLAWRQMSETALRCGLPPEDLAALAESLFCFIDQLSSASVTGYFAEQSEAAAERERARDELVELLLSDRSDGTVVRGAAIRAGWPVPETAAIVFVEQHNVIGRSMVSRLDPSCLPVRTSSLLGAIVPDPAAPGRRDRLTSMLRGSSAVVGPTVTLEHLPASARIAEAAARLQREGILTQDPVFVDEHIDAIIVHREPRLLAALRAQVLAPLEEVSPATSATLRETLRAWLRHMGDRQEIAAELRVHPQTVRYRMARLRELFGEALNDPEARLRLHLALEWDLEGGRRPPAPRRQP